MYTAADPFSSLSPLLESPLMPLQVRRLLGMACSRHVLSWVSVHQQAWALEQPLSLICASCTSVAGEQFERPLQTARSSNRAPRYMGIYIVLSVASFLIPNILSLTVIPTGRPVGLLGR